MTRAFSVRCLVVVLSACTYVLQGTQPRETRPWSGRNLFESYRLGRFGVEQLTSRQWSTAIAPGHLRGEAAAWLDHGDPREREVRLRAAVVATVELYDGCARLRVCQPRGSSPGLRPVPGAVADERELLTQAAVATGGRTHGTGLFAGSVTSALGRLIEEFRHGYVLTYTADGVPASGWHEVSVAVPAVPGAAVRARRGYFAAPEPRG